MNKNKEKESRVNLLSIFKDNKFFYLLGHSVGKTYLDAFRGINTVYAIEIDSENLRLIKVRKKDDKILKVEADTEPIRNLPKSIPTILSRQGYGGEEILVNVSGIYSLNKIVEMDLEKDETVEDWIIRNKERLLPPAGDEEIGFDYVVLQDDNRKFLYVSIIRRNKLKQLYQIFRQNHLNVTSLTSDSLSLYSLLRRIEEIAKLQKLVLVLLKDKSAEVTFLTRGTPIFVTLAALAEQKEELVANITNFMHFCFGGNERAENWRFLVLGEKDIVPSYKHVFEKAGLSFLEDSWLQKHPNRLFICSNYATPFSLIHRSDSAIIETTTNFLSSSDRVNSDTKSITKVFRRILKAFLLLLIVLGVLNIGFAVFDSLNKDKVKNFENKMEVLTELKQENQALEERWGRVSQMLLNRSGKSRLLYLVSKYCPEGIWLRNLYSESIFSSQRTEIAGLSLSQTDVTGFLQNLEESNLFENIKLVYLDRVETADLTKLPSKYKDNLYKFKIGFQDRF